MRTVLTPEEFYERTKWPIGTTVRDTQDHSRIGVIVAQGGRIWVNRTKLPYVRWHGIIDAEPVAWDRIERI